MDTQPDLEQHANDPRSVFNGLVFALIVFAVGIGATAGWMRYSNRRACGFQDAAHEAMGGLLPQFSLAGGPVAPGGCPRFVCPQCSSYCWTPSRAGCPLCPFCVQPMVQEVPGVAPVGSMTPAAGTVPIVPIQAGTRAPHGNRGVCTNCHTVLGAVNPGLAPPIQAVKPILIKPFGMEVGPAISEGAQVTGVMGNSNASKAGLVAGDVVVECNGKKVADADRLAQLIAAAAPEANAQLKIVRNGRLQKVAVMVGEGEMEGFIPIARP